MTATTEIDESTLPHNWAKTGINAVVLTVSDQEAFAWIEAGYTALPLSHEPLTDDSQLDIEKTVGDMSSFQRYYIAIADGVLRDEVARRLGTEKCFQAPGPPSDDTIDRAQPYPVNGVITVNMVRDKFEDFIVNGLPPGMAIGIPSLDAAFTTALGRLTVVTGIPSHGKSEFVEMLVVELSRQHRLRCAIFSPEHDPSQHLARLVTKATGQAIEEGYHGYEVMTKETRTAALDWLHDWFFFIGDGNQHLSVDQILALAESLVLRQGIKLLVIDPWTEVEKVKPHGMSDTEYIGKCLSDLKMFARKYSLHIFLVAHPKQMQRDNKGNYPVPTPYDISGSAHFRNRSDNCITVHRTFAGKGQPQPPVLIRTSKIKYRSEGHCGDVRLEYEPATSRYREPRTVNTGDWE